MNSGLEEDWKPSMTDILRSAETEEGKRQVQNLYPNIDNVLNCLSEQPFQSKACSTSILAQGFGYEC